MLRPLPQGGCRLEWDGTQTDVDLATVRFSARIAHITRRISFANGGYFETADNDGIDQLLAALRQPRSWVQWLERQWPVALLSLVLVVGISVWTVTSGLPWLAGRIANHIPPSVDATLGGGVLQILDGQLLQPSTLSARRQQELQQQFAAVIPRNRSDYRWQLQLRDGQSIGANAFALPGGTVVMTDQLVDLSRHDEELVSVMAHEAGHVLRRHGVQQLVQGVGVSALAMVVFGDVTSLSTLTGAAPALLQARYSRDMEREADVYARDWLNRHSIRQQRFDDLLCRLAAKHNDERDALNDYFASHPAVSDRAHCP